MEPIVCVNVFRPLAVAPLKASMHLALQWVQARHSRQFKNTKGPGTRNVSDTPRLSQPAPRNGLCFLPGWPVESACRIVSHRFARPIRDLTSRGLLFLRTSVVAFPGVSMATMSPTRQSLFRQGGVPDRVYNPTAPPPPRGKGMGP